MYFLYGHGAILYLYLYMWYSSRPWLCLSLLFQPLEVKPLPLKTSEKYDYMLSLKQEFRGCIRDSPYFLKPKAVKKGEGTHYL